MRTASWILLALVGAITLFFSLESAWVAYHRGPDRVVTAAASSTDAAGGRESTADALRGRRGTAAAFGAAYSVLFLAIVLGPYRGGDRWSWWTLLAGAAVLAAITAARIPTLGIRGGVGTAVTHLGVALVGLLLDAGRLRSAAR